MATVSETALQERPALNESLNSLGGILGNSQPPRNALDAAARIRAGRQVLSAVQAQCEAMVMESLWVIRKQYPEQAAFAGFIDEQLGDVLTADKAWSYSQVWEVARRQRSLREMAGAQPDQVVLLVKDIGDAVGAELDEDDQRLVEALSLPPRKRWPALRRLLGVAEAPAPVSAAPAPLATLPTASLLMQLREARRGLLFCRDTMVDDGSVDSAVVSERTTEEMRLVVDEIIGVAEEIAGVMLDHTDRG